MIGDIPIVTFDTSAHNRLALGDPNSEQILAGINSTLWFRFAGSSVEEMFATSKPDDRRDLLGSCRRLQRGPSQVLLPPNRLTEELVLAHQASPGSFDWKAVDVRWPKCEAVIRDPGFYDDEEASRSQREFQKERKKVGKQELLELRREVQTRFEAYGELLPTAFRPAIARLESAENSSVWAAAKRFYDKAARIDTGLALVREFITLCPPIRALVYAIFVPWYNTAMRDPLLGEKLAAGNNDLFMSVYLPYCDWFVTDDEGQERALREVAAHTGLGTEVLSYDDFSNRVPTPSSALCS